MVSTSLRVAAWSLIAFLTLDAFSQTHASGRVYLTIEGIRKCGDVSRCAVVTVHNDTDVAQEVPISDGEVPEPHYGYEVRETGKQEWQHFAFSIGSFTDSMRSKTVPAHGRRTVLVWIPTSMPFPERYESYRLSIRLRSKLIAHSDPFGAGGPVFSPK
ncbi:MAG TPA: hypothetical protein VJ806_01745 [Luteimonas sp.]|nr:hypothetical protein [Luteimonas sp.]